MGRKAIEVDIKSDGDLFHELLRNKPHDISELTPIIHACNLHEGEWGTVGSVITWHYIHDGKDTIGKEIITDIDEEKKSITFKYIEGELLELYKTIVIIVHVEKKGENDVVTWTIDYEKVNEGVPDPDFVLEMFKNITKHIEAEHVKS